MSISKRAEWSVALVAARESLDTLHATLKSVLQASVRPTQIDVMVNGNRELAEGIAGLAPLAGSTYDTASVRVWSIDLGDKAYALNQYFHHVWPEGALAFLVDGYVRLRPDAMVLLASAVAADEYSLAGTGVPITGRSATSLKRRMMAEGGFHGNFCCIKADVMKNLKVRGFRLPLGLYRVDSTLGAVLNFGLDPGRYDWDPRRIHVQPDAGWTTDDKKWWRFSDIAGQFKRLQRQAQGQLENLAVQDHLRYRRCAPELLPATVQQLVLDWIQRCPEAAGLAMRRNPLCCRAIAQLGEPRDWSLANAVPIRLA